MSGIIKMEELINTELEQVAPNLIKFYDKKEIIDMLKRGDDIAQELNSHKEQVEKDQQAYLDQKLTEAEVESESIKNAARKEGLKLGQQEGFERVMKEIESFQALMEETKNRMEQYKDDIYSKIETDVVKLSIAIAEKLVQAKLKLDPGFFVVFVKSVLKYANEHRRIVLQANSKNYKLLVDNLGALKKSSDAREFLIEENDAIEENGVVFEMESGDIDGQISKQLERISAHLFE
jgi:flagellar assembly protein FliH